MAVGDADWLGWGQEVGVVRLEGKAMEWNVWIGSGPMGEGGRGKNARFTSTTVPSLRSSRSIKCSCLWVMSLPKSPVARSSFRPWGHEDGIQSGHRRQPVSVASTVLVQCINGFHCGRTLFFQSYSETIRTLLLVCSDAEELVRETWPGDAVARDSVQDVVVVVVLLLYVSFDGS